MATKKQYYNWMKTRWIVGEIGETIVFLLILWMYHLGHNTIAFILLILLIADFIGKLIGMKELSQLAGMKKW